MPTPPRTRKLRREAVYRCRERERPVLFGQTIPPECMDQDVEVLDASGRVVRTIPGRESLEAVATAEGRRGGQGRARNAIARCSQPT